MVGKSLADTSITAGVEGTYVYTGKAINPNIVVKDGTTVLKEGTDYKVVSKTGTEAGDAYVTIEGMNNYAGKLTLKYTIVKADLANATVNSSKDATNKKTNYDVSYSGLALAPDVDEVKIGDKVLQKYDPINKTGDYELTYDEDAVEVGTYNFTITAVASSTKVQGEFKGTFKILPNKLTAHFGKKSTPATGVNKYIRGFRYNYTGKAIT